MRRIVYTICLRNGIEIESTFSLSYARALASQDLGCYFTTRVMNIPRKLPPADRLSAEKRAVSLALKKAGYTPLM